MANWDQIRVWYIPSVPGANTEMYLLHIDEVMNYLIMVPIYQSKAEEIGEDLIEHVVTKYCVPDYNNGPGQHIYIITYELFVQ